MFGPAVTGALLHDLRARSSTFCELYARGHILGSGCVALRAEGKTITFSGDVGRPMDPIMKAPDPLPPTDYLVVESTYGLRRHPVEDVAEALGKIVRETAAQGGAVVVPAFAVGRAQDLLHIFAQLKAAGRIPNVPVYLDSPMSINATEIRARRARAAPRAIVPFQRLIQPSALASCLHGVQIPRSGIMVCCLPG